MNDHDLDLFEKELQALKPSRPPEEFVERLSKSITEFAVPHSNPVLNHPSTSRFGFQTILAQLQFHLRWLAPATVIVLASIVVLRSDLLGLRLPSPGAASAPSPAMKADDVKIDSTLVSSYDAVANLPDGEPVRFRCEEWVDEVRLKDSSRGLVYSQKVPRVTVVPVRFETY